MKTIFIILSLVLLTSCEYDYIFDNPNHPQEYMGNWVCDSTLPKGSLKRNFSIMQTGVGITTTTLQSDWIHTITTTTSYNDFKVDQAQTTFTLINIINDKRIDVLMYKIVKRPTESPYGLMLKDTANNVTYYLHD